MHDAVVVCDRQRVGHLDRDCERALHVERPPVHQLADGPPLQELHDDVEEPVRLADLVDGGDVRVLQRRAQQRLLVEAAPGDVRLGQLRAQHLDDDRPPEAQVLRLVGGRLPTLSEWTEDAVVRERRAGIELGHGTDGSR